MLWKISAKNKSFMLDIPEEIATEKKFSIRSIVDKKDSFFIWRPRQRYLVKLHLENNGYTLEENFRIRNQSVATYAGESDTQTQVEVSGSSLPGVCYVAHSLQRYSPGMDSRQNAQAKTKKTLRSPMTGKLLKCLVAAGDSVESGQALAIIEAMKMENRIPSPVNAKIKSIKATEGSNVTSGQVLIEFET